MTTTQKKSYALPIAMMFLLFFIISFVTGLQNPLGVIVKDQFHLSNFQSQLGNLANFLAYLFMGIPAGKMLESIGYKKTALTALVMGFIGVLVMFIGGQTGLFYVYLAGAFISGFTMCTLNTVVNPMLTVLGNPDRANQRLNFGGALNSFGATIVPILGGMLMGNAAQKNISDANPLLFLAMGIFALVFIVLSFVKIPEPHIVKKDAKKQKDKYSALSFRHFILGMVAIFIYVGVEVGIPNIANLYMTSKTTQTEQIISNVTAGQSLNESTIDAVKPDKDFHPGLGINEGIAGTIVGVYWLLMMIGRLLGGALGGVLNSKQLLTGASALAIVLILLAIFCNTATTITMPGFNSETFSLTFSQVPINILFLMLCGLCTSVMWAGIFNLATNGLGKYIAQGSGLFMTMVVGGGVLPLIQGKVADVAGYLSSYWVIIIGLAFLLYYALIGSKNVNKNIPVE